MSEEAKLYFGGEIYTVDDACPRVQALAVQRGTIVAAGSLEDCRKVLSAKYHPIDLSGATLLPGFIDTHLHPVALVFFDMNVNLSLAGSIAEMQSMLRETTRNKSSGTWIIGLNFDEQSLVEKSLPNRHDLDDACPDNPVLILKHDGHMAIGNTQAIIASGITASTSDPEGGRIDREQDGFPAGVFREEAKQVLLNAMPMPEMETLFDSAAGTFSALVSQGITSAGVVLQTDEEGPAGTLGAFDVMFMEMVLEHVPFNMYSMLITKDIARIEEARRTALHNQDLGSHRIGAIKIFADGTFGSATAFMFEPFSDQPDKSGFMTHSPEEIYALMVAAHRAEIQIGIHAIGDAANRVCIDLYDRLLKEYPRADHRHRLEHASQLDVKMIADIARLGLVVSTQPLFIHSEKHWLHKRLGHDRTGWTYPLRALLDAGVRVAGASDAPVESTEVLHAIQCCVTREGFEVQQAITAAEAVRMFTIDAAYAQFEDSIKGSLSPGKRADMVILSANPISIEPEKIRNIKVLQTIIGGNAVYQA
ncbi:MAG: amidohydrolase [Deltaproteobacteria bacterium]|nr:amidohydrolase [Deltaproteobacteria bacterium]